MSRETVLKSIELGQDYKCFPLPSVTLREVHTPLERMNDLALEDV